MSSKNYVNEFMLRFIREHEGLALFPYRCTSGKLTIGYGHNLESCGIPEVVADLLLLLDTACAVDTSREIFAEFPSFTPMRQMAITDMVFNLGEAGFLTFKKMIKAIKVNDWNEAAIEAADSKWATQVGSRAEQIIKILREGE